ncbi:hypothetical protein QCA50_012735 [Cerrena zonata]|uniref:Uncharacterized protein n=1 Tax=Cerrena zonata TaxID=2478898 RepID=A0AAW0G2G0_9APHY
MAKQLILLIPSLAFGDVVVRWRKLKYQKEIRPIRLDGGRVLTHDKAREAD